MLSTQETDQCDLHLFFSGLISGVQYNTYVSAINGVSGQVERNTSSLVIASSPPPPVVFIVIVVLVQLYIENREAFFTCERGTRQAPPTIKLTGDGHEE